MLSIAAVDDLTPLVPQVAEVYRSAFSIFADGPTDKEVRAFSQDTIPRHAEREGFRFIAALDDEKLIGFIYGYHGRRGEWWEDWILARLPQAIFDEWFDNQFDLTEFCVTAEHHGQGIGSLLYDALFDDLAGTRYERAVLTTRRVNNPARGFYLRRGWEVVWDALDDRFSLLGRRLL